MQNTKQDRHLAIKEVITRDRITSQDDLKRALAEIGIEISQATLSRDLQEIGVVKGHAGSSRYTLPGAGYGTNVAGYSIVNLEVSGNMAVLKTLPGHASMYASLIDSKGLPEVVGTIAGDDTIFLVLRNGVSETDLLRSVSSILTVKK